MKKLLSGIYVVLLSWSFSGVQANSLQHRLDNFNKMVETTMKKKNATKMNKRKDLKDDDKCINFSGTWEGSCKNSSSEDSYNQKITINQMDCYQINHDGEVFTTEGMSTQAFNGRYFSSSISTVPVWNQGRNKLKVSQTVVKRTIDSYEYLYRGISNFYLSIESDQLVEKLVHETIVEHGDGNTDHFNFEQMCVYKKAL